MADDHGIFCPVLQHFYVEFHAYNEHKKDEPDLAEELKVAKRRERKKKCWEFGKHGPYQGWTQDDSRGDFADYSRLFYFFADKNKILIFFSGFRPNDWNTRCYVNECTCKFITFIKALHWFFNLN